MPVGRDVADADVGAVPLQPRERSRGPRPPLDADAARALARAADARAAILVEGWSDQAAVEALALRRGHDLRAEGIVVVPIGGATNVERFVRALGPHGLGLRLAGLCDVAELQHVRRALVRAGVGASGAARSADHDGFHACDADLEDELIRALGTATVERVLDGERELASFRRFQGQPAQRGRELHAQLRRFLGTRAGRKVRYGALLVNALDLDRVPRALDRVLADVQADNRGGRAGTTTLAAPTSSDAPEENAMTTVTELRLPELGLLVGTRAMLGAGVALLLADKLGDDTRRGVGWTLVAVGALTTIPLAMLVLGRRRQLA